MTFTKIAIATFGLLLLAGTNHASAASKSQGANAYECVTDDGYGRKRSCSAAYMQARADGKTYECVTDDGYGRKLPCSFRIKR